MIRISQLKLETDHTKKQLVQKICKELSINQDMLVHYEIRKQSIDARKKPMIFYVYVVDAEVSNEKKVLSKIKNKNISVIEEKPYVFPVTGDRKLNTPPVIIGSGPAGLFCGYMLAKAGYCPLILEQGEDVDRRSESVEEFWNTGVLKENSNVQFGEGGAGTFSDGKLNTLVKDKYGRNRKVLEIFVENGASEKILYEAKPHIGTDVLKTVVKNMRKNIEKWGGLVQFEKKVTDFSIEDGKIVGITVNEREYIQSRCVILAIGHSARDTFFKLYEKGLRMENKPFAVGFRIEHPQQMIDEEMYGKEGAKKMPPAPYKLTAKTSTSRGVYSFCMCPGGYVVNASSEKNALAINGMSYSKRDSKSANSAIVVTVGLDDLKKDVPLSGIRFQRKLEQAAYILGKGKIPYTTYGKLCENLGKKITHQEDEEKINSIFRPFTHNTKGEIYPADLSHFLPREMMESFLEAMEHFNKIIPGFTHPDTQIYAVESRTSSPVRILRDEESLESNFSGLYPCGEGAGYAGGITSAGMDGIKVAEKIATIYKSNKEQRDEFFS